MFAAFCFNRSGRTKEKALYTTDIQGFLLSTGVSFCPPLERKTGLGPATSTLARLRVALYQLSYFRNMYPNSCFGTANINRIFDSAKFFTTFPETKHPDRTTIGVFVEYWLTVRFNEP